MKKIFTALTAVAVTASAFAQITGSLDPAGGKLYSGDLKHGGSIAITYSEAVGHTEVTDSSYVAVPPVATITVNNQTVVLDAYEKGNTGLYWGIAFQEAVNNLLPTPKVNEFYTMNVSVTATAPDKTVQTLTGSYEYCPVFPFTGATPEANDTLTSKTETIVFNFNQPVTYTGVVITSGSKVTTLDGGSSTNNQVSVPLSESYWAAASATLSHIYIKLTGVTLGNGEEISNVSNEDASIAVGYSYEETIATATFLGVEQDPYWWLAQDLFGMSVDFNFNAAVNYDNASAEIKFYEEETPLPEYTTLVSSSEMVMGHNMRTGNYYLAVPIPDKTSELYDPSLDMWFFTKMTVTIYGVNAIDLSNPYTDSYDVVFPEDDLQLAPKKAQSAGIGNTVILENALVDVYSIDGTLVKSKVNAESINSLGRGLYIVNGKKVLVK